VRVGEGGPRVSFPTRRRSQPPLYSDLFKKTCLDTGCHLFLTGGYLTETDHLRALILQLIPHGEKHLEELVFVGWRHEFGGLPLSGDTVVGWESSASEIWTTDV